MPTKEEIELTLKNTALHCARMMESDAKRLADDSLEFVNYVMTSLSIIVSALLMQISSFMHDDVDKEKETQRMFDQLKDKFVTDFRQWQEYRKTQQPEDNVH